MFATKKEIIDRLQKDILSWQGYKAPAAGSAGITGLGPVESAFPNAVFPIGAIHEFLNFEPEQAAANNGFISGLLKSLMNKGGICLWISVSRKLFPPALKLFGVNPEQFIFIDLKRERDLLWVMEEALKCEGLAAVICEVREIGFAESRRLQLVVEKSKVTGFILRSDPHKISTTACVARWKIIPLPSAIAGGMPGVGFPRWQIELLKVRNGNPGMWQMEWMDGRFIPLAPIITEAAMPDQRRKAG